MIKKYWLKICLSLFILFGSIFVFYSIGLAENPQLSHWQNTSQKFEFDYPYKWIIKNYDVAEGTFSIGTNSNLVQKLTVQSSNTSCSQTAGCKSIAALTGSSYKYLNLTVDSGTQLWQEVLDSFQLIPGSEPPVTPVTVTPTPNPTPTTNTVSTSIKVITKHKSKTTTSVKLTTAGVSIYQPVYITLILFIIINLIRALSLTKPHEKIINRS